MKTLIVYSSKYGATETCAQRIHSKLGGNCDLVNLLDNQLPSLVDYDMILLGSSIYAGKLRPAIVKFIAEEEKTLKEKTFGIFLSCKDEGEEALRYIEDTLPRWVYEKAFVKTDLGHEVHLEKMNFFERNLFKFIFKVKESYSKLNESNIEKLVERISEKDKE